MTSIKAPKNGSDQTPQVLGQQVHPHIRRPDTPERVKAMISDTRRRLRRLQSERITVEREMKGMLEDDLRLTMRRGLRARLRTLRRQIRETLSALAVLVNHDAVRPATHDSALCCLCIAERGES